MAKHIIILHSQIQGGGGGKESLKQLVMVNEELYYNTEKENTMPMKCGTMDGEILSMVNQNEIPKENNQSNFGKGYGYQIWTTR